MKKLLLTWATALLGAAGAQAQTMTMTIHKTDGSTVSYPVSEVEYVDFTPASTPDQQVAGTYIGTDHITVGGNDAWQFDATEATDYVVVAEADGTLSVTIPEESFQGLPIGDITVGSYTVSHLAWSEADQAFVRNYGEDGIQTHFKSTGAMSLDTDYTFDHESCRLVVSLDADGKLRLSNTYRLGRMPMGIVSEFTGTRK